MGTVGKRFDVAVFPLINAVLFPGTTLPLHIFEDRYGQMLHDLQARRWPLAVSLAEPKQGEQFTLNTICGAGEVQIFKQYPNGTYDILVHGQKRVKLLSIVQQEPYFIMEAEELEPELELASEKLKGPSFREFLALIKTWAFINPRFPEKYTLLFDQFSDFGDLSDFFVFHFLKRPALKQKYLNCADPRKRADMLTHYLENDLVRLSQDLARLKNAHMHH